MNAVDTNVYVYTFDPDEPMLNQLRRWESKGDLTAQEVEENFHRHSSQFEIRLPTPTAFQASFDLRKRFSLSHWDSMLLAACKEAGVTTLYSEDMDAGTDYDGVRIINPFA
jgi:predicted nucleic acid-binding protein